MGNIISLPNTQPSCHFLSVVAGAGHRECDVLGVRGQDGLPSLHISNATSNTGGWIGLGIFPSGCPGALGR